MFDDTRQLFGQEGRRLAGAGRLAVLVAVGLLLALPGGVDNVEAGPEGGRVVAGSGSIQRPNPLTTLVTQRSGSLAIDWSRFDVAANELVRFQQPSASSAVLNRIFNELPSQIFGTIKADGRVFLMNPNGVIFGAGSRVEVGALFASSLDISVDDFMRGDYRFAAPDGVDPGAVINRGLIQAATGGGVTLLGGTVRNEGVILADVGHVLMGAGRRALVDFDGDGLIRFEIDEALLNDVSGVGTAVANSGEIRADGGQVILSAEVAQGVFDHAVNNEGVIRAARIDRSPGGVTLAGRGASVRSTGSIDVSANTPGTSGGSVEFSSDMDISQAGRIRADGNGADGGRIVLDGAGLTLLEAGSSLSARAEGGHGGEVLVLGQSVALLDAATIDVSGGFGGGSVLLGGDYQGSNPLVRNATRTGVAPGAAIVADATDTGDGGRVIVWSDEATNFYGRISARGGPAGGDGGFAEVSGKSSLAYRGSADLSASDGSRGSLLLDPRFLVIFGGVGDGDGDASNGTFTGDGPSTVGEILFSDLGPSIIYESEIEIQSASADITLQASDSIVVANSEFNHNSGHPGDSDSGTLALAPGSHLVIETRDSGTGEAGFLNRISLSTSVHGPDLNIVTSGSGTITIRSGVGSDENIQMLLPNLLSASDILLSAGGGPSSSISLSGNVSGHNVDIDATGTVNVSSGARVIAGGDGTALTIDASGITLEDGAPGAATVSNSGTGTVSLTSTVATDIELGEHAISTGVGLLSLNAGGSIVASDPTTVVNEISAAGIDERSVDGGGLISAEITADGTVSLVAATGIGDAGMLDLAAASGDDAAFEATVAHGSIRVRGVDGLRVVGSGISTPGGGALAAGGALSIGADITSGADMRFSAGEDADTGGDDLTLESGVRVALESDTDATLTFTAGDHIIFDGGTVKTGGVPGADGNGGPDHRVVLRAGTESGGSDGVLGDVMQSGDAVSVAAARLDVVAEGGIGLTDALRIEISDRIDVRSKGVDGSGDIRMEQVGDLATRQLATLATDSESAQTVAVSATGALRVDDDPVDTPNLQFGDLLELDGAGIELSSKVSGKDVDLRFKAPVSVTLPGDGGVDEIFVTLGEGVLTFDGNVSPGPDTTLVIKNRVAFGSGNVTGSPGSGLRIEDVLDLVTDTTLEVDELELRGGTGSIIGSGDLTLLPATHGRDIVIGGLDGLARRITLATLEGFGAGRIVSIGVPTNPAGRSPFAGNVIVREGLSVGNAELTIGGLGDVTFDNHATPLRSTRRVNIVAIGDDAVFPGLVTHSGGDIIDTDATAGAPAVIDAPEVNLIAQGGVGTGGNAFGVRVGSSGSVNFVTGEVNAFINTAPAGRPVINVADTSDILATFQSLGFFGDPLSRAALARTVGLETTGLETTGLGELGYVDEGVFLLPDPFTTPVQATLLPALMDPDFPADRRPEDPDAEAEWQAFYTGVLRNYVESRYLLPDDASDAERQAVGTRIETEWQALVDYFEQVRAQEGAVLESNRAASGDQT